MFYRLILENETGQQIDLSQTASRFMFCKIEGLNPPPGTISTSTYAGMDGSYLNNAFIEKRNVVISFPMLKGRKKVAAYCRVSMESERMMHSISAQIS